MRESRLRQRISVGTSFWRHIYQRDPTLTDVYARAASLLERHGWWRGPNTEPAMDPNEDATRGCSGSMCIATAVVRACSPSLAEPALGHLRRSLGLSGEGSLADWNDAPGRTLGEVLRALRAASVEPRR